MMVVSTSTEWTIAMISRFHTHGKRVKVYSQRETSMEHIPMRIPFPENSSRVQPRFLLMF